MRSCRLDIILTATMWVARQSPFLVQQNILQLYLIVLTLRMYFHMRPDVHDYENRSLFSAECLYQYLCGQSRYHPLTCTSRARLRYRVTYALGLSISCTVGLREQHAITTPWIMYCAHGVIDAIVGKYDARKRCAR